jgi:uncharacterized protein DUF4159
VTPIGPRPRRLVPSLPRSSAGSCLLAVLWMGGIGGLGGMAVMAAVPGPARAQAPGHGADLTGGFTIARLKYTGGGDWYSDESSLRNLLKALRARGEVRVAQEREAVVSASDPELWNYPLLFMTGHGNVKLSEEESRSLRRYLDQGGFLWADDNFGMDKSFRELMARLYPETPMTELPFDHEVFRRPFAFPSGAPKIHEHDGGPPHVYGIYRDGRLRVLYTFDTDIGNGIEDAGIHDDPPAKRDAAMRFAINIATYAVTN